MYTPSIHISRQVGAGVTAEGYGDELSSLLLQRTGFLPVSTPHSSWWRAPYDLDPAEEREIASAAYDMLTAARYAVTIAPELRSRPAASAREVKAMADEITNADNLGTVTTLLSTMSDVNDGTLIEVARMISDAAHWTATKPACTYRDGLAFKLSQARRAMESAQEYLEDALGAMAFVTEQMRGLRTAKTVSKASAEPRVSAASARSAKTSGPSASAPPPSPVQSQASAAGRRP